jgi:molybdopterin synthase catalytic subunit
MIKLPSFRLLQEDNLNLINSYREKIIYDNLFEFELTHDSIQGGHLRNRMLHPSCGAIVVFEGWVRDFNEGRVVTALHYEAYPELVQNEAKVIFAEAQNKFQLRSALVVHRIGQLNIGEIAVWVGVTSIHRQASFLACQYLIDELKIRLPIWKKEFYSDFDSGWVNCQACLEAKQTIKPLA